MKNKLHSKHILIFCFFLCLVFSSYGQTKFVKNSDIFGTRTFIKNNGQFNGIIPNNSQVDYAYINGNEQVYFNKHGVTYFLQKKMSLSHSQHEAMEHGEKIVEKSSKKAFVNVSWQNSNPNVEFIVSDKESYYYTFGDKKIKSDCYKKITYKNIYDNIDIEYLFTDERVDGIKYNIILHPGANVNDIKIKYAGDFKKVVLKNGNVIIKTAVYNITELAPISYQNGLKISTNFKVEKNIVSFDFPEGYDKTKQLIIDPWVVNLTLNNINYGYDVDYDFAGNYYVYGGSSPFQVSKYSPTGVLLWSHAVTVPSINWGYWMASNFAVDKVSQYVYVGEAFAPGARIVRLDPFGIYDNFLSQQNPNFEEIWDMGYRDVDGAIFGLGGGTSSNLSGGILNTLTSQISSYNYTNLPQYYQDAVSHAIDNSGNVFMLVVIGALWPLTEENKLISVNASFTGNNWVSQTNYNTISESGNKHYPDGPSYSNGYNALAVNSCYLFFYDGFNLAAYNKTTGAQVGATTIAGQIIKNQGGIAVDECNNIYVGGNDVIKCFNFNGTNFVSNGFISVASNTELKYITDIKFKSNTKELFVCGSGFGGIYSAINSINCSNSVSIIPEFDLISICKGDTPPILSNISLNGISGTWQPSIINNLTTGTYLFTPNVGQCTTLTYEMEVKVLENFDFVIIQECFNKNYTLQINPINNSFDANSSIIVWQNSNNTNIGSGNSTFNVTDYLNTNSITPQFPLLFSANITLPNGCVQSHTVVVDKVYCEIQKGISPNGDNNNDYFDLELLNVKKLDIFNRYGLKVYSKDQYKNEWYGQTDSGKILSDGTYYYVIEFNSKEPTVTGWIYVINQN